MTKSIFIGRNIEVNSRKWLEKQSVDYVEQPLIDIRLKAPNNSFLSRIGDTKRHWVITSQWSAKWLLLNHGHIGFKINESIFCLSNKQAEMLKHISNDIHISDNCNSDSVSKQVQQRNNGETVIFLKGDKTLSILNKACSRIKGNYHEIEVYKNTLLTPNVEKQFDAYLFFSPSGIESFVKGKNSRPNDAIIVTIGKITGKKAKENFDNQIFLSPVPDELTMIQFAYSILKRQDLTFNYNTNSIQIRY